MRKDLLQIVCCPDDKAHLELRDGEEDEHGDVVTGKLHCSECGFDFPIEDGIPNLLPKAYHVDAVKDKKTRDAMRAAGAGEEE